MGKIFSDATPEQESEFIEQRRKEAFLAACRWPLSWGMHAERHKLAADHLYEIAYSASQRELLRWLNKPFESGSRTLEGEELADFRNSQLISDYLLLAGYSLECIFKGILIMERPELVVDDSRLDKLVTIHDLIRLARECNISLSEDEAGILASMSREIVWGKYPAPKKMDDMPSPVDPDDLRRKANGLQNPFHERRVQKIVDSIYAKTASRFIELREE